ncbi:MAG: alkaline shock response membrane anchor protein AmaP [Solirubrobacteraceae bacterium MAG38_C4-C5]|nr:alkaline shock response membrane anchor protein AmaP [Candidatus Siliceabacter maunaloa]
MRTRSLAPAVWICRLLTIAFAAALIFYGVMLILLALKFAPGDIETISGYATTYEFLAGLTAQDIDSTVRAIVAAAGILCAIVLGWVAYKALPRPYLARGTMHLSGGEDETHGHTDVGARAVERLAAHAAGEHPAVAGATSRLEGEAVAVGVALNRPGEVADVLPDVQRRVRAQLERHDLPILPVNVTLTGLEAGPRMELR